MDKNKKTLRTLVILYFSLFIITGILFWAWLHGLNTAIDNQAVMLCESARTKNGDPEWREKCQCYYETGNIVCTYPKQ